MRIIDGVTVMMDTPAMAAVPRSALGMPVTSLAASQSEILAALDRLFGAFQASEQLTA